jgi:hypothetical protein
MTPCPGRKPRHDIEPQHAARPMRPCRLASAGSGPVDLASATSTRRDLAPSSQAAGLLDELEAVLPLGLLPSRVGVVRPACAVCLFSGPGLWLLAAFLPPFSAPSDSIRPDSRRARGHPHCARSCNASFTAKGHRLDKHGWGGVGAGGGTAVRNPGKGQPPSMSLSPAGCQSTATAAQTLQLAYP